MLNRTMLGVSMRAAAEDFQTAQLVGVRANRVVVTAFAIAGLLAGVASVLYIARSGSVQPTTGFDPVVKAFIATVIGGLGSLYGAVAGGFVLGFTEVAVQRFPPDTSCRSATRSRWSSSSACCWCARRDFSGGSARCARDGSGMGPAPARPA